MRLYLCVRKRYGYVLPGRAEKKVRLFQAHTRIRKQKKHFGAENAALTRLEQKRLRQSHTSAEFLVLCVLLRGRFPPAAISIAYVSGIFGSLRATLRQMPNGYVNRIRQRNFWYFACYFAADALRLCQSHTSAEYYYFFWYFACYFAADAHTDSRYFAASSRRTCQYKLVPEYPLGTHGNSLLVLICTGSP